MKAKYKIINYKKRIREPKAPKYNNNKLKDLKTRKNLKPKQSNKDQIHLILCKKKIFKKNLKRSSKIFIQITKIKFKE